jgi:hypothetical protein
MVKHNDIVQEAKGDGGHWGPYGRVSRIIDADHVEVLDVLRDCTIYHVNELTVHNDYKGMDVKKIDSFGYEYYTWHWMPSLRRLKQMRAYYDRTVWKKVRKNKKLYMKIRLERGW